MSSKTISPTESAERKRKRYERNRAFAKANPEIIKERKRRHYLKHREKILERVSRYNQKHKDRKSQADRLRYVEHRESIAIKSKLYAKSEKGIAARLDLKKRRQEFSKFRPSRTAYDGMLARCYSINNSNYPQYGGRGIRVCDRWQGRDGYRNFCNDIGPRPQELDDKGRYLFSIDRIDVNGNYEPGNVRWADRVTQANNQRRNIKIAELVSDLNLIYHNGGLITLLDFSKATGIYLMVVKYRWLQYPLNSDWMLHSDIDNRYFSWKNVLYNLKEISIISGLPYRTVHSRLVKLGWTVEETIETPLSESHAHRC